VCFSAAMSMTVRPQAPSVAIHTSTSLPESIGRPPRPWVKITSNSINGLRYSTCISVVSYLLDIYIDAISLLFLKNAFFFNVNSHLRFDGR